MAVLAAVDVERNPVGPPCSDRTPEAIGTAIRTRALQSTHLPAHVGLTGERDALPAAAGWLLDLEGVEPSSGSASSAER